MDSFRSDSLEETRQIGHRLAGQFEPGMVVTLNGPLGAGKTTLVRSIAEGLGCENAFVNSPTFIVVQEYDGPLPVFHIDAYRLRDSDEFFEIGGEEFFEAGGGLPDRVGGADRRHPPAGSRPDRHPPGRPRLPRVPGLRNRSLGPLLANLIPAAPVEILPVGDIVTMLRNAGTTLLAMLTFALMSGPARGQSEGNEKSAPPAAAAIAPEDVQFQAECDGTDQRYVLLLPPNFANDRPHDLLVALHGHGSDRWQFVRDPRDECRAARDAAARSDMIFVSPDYRARTSWMGPQAEADLVQILKDLKARFRIGRVLVSGGSMGGTSALSFAALHPELCDGVVALNGMANHLEYENFQEAIAASFGTSKKTDPAEYKKRSAEYWPERLTMPIAITTGGRDTLVPPESALRLAAVLKRLDRPVLTVHRPEGGHSSTYDDSLQAYTFVIERLRAQTPSR